MTKAHIKEELSKHFIGALASFKGISVNKPEKDYGVDLKIELLETYSIGNRIRYAQTGKSVDIQLKATTEKNIEKTDNFIKFDLKIENYNDLIRRRNSLMKVVGGHIPMVLIVVVLPENEKKWLEQKEQGILMRGNAYWFYPDEDMLYSINNSSKRIEIPLKNKVNLDFFDFIFKLRNKKIIQ